MQKHIFNSDLFFNTSAAAVALENTSGGGGDGGSATLSSSPLRDDLLPTPTSTHTVTIGVKTNEDGTVKDKDDETIIIPPPPAGMNKILKYSLFGLGGAALVVIVILVIRKLRK